MTRHDRLAIMAAIIYTGRTIALNQSDRAIGGWEKSPVDVADMLDGEVQHLLETSCDEEEPLTPGHRIGCDCHDCVQARIEAAG